MCSFLSKIFVFLSSVILHHLQVVVIAVGSMVPGWSRLIFRLPNRASPILTKHGIGKGQCLVTNSGYYFMTCLPEKPVRLEIRNAGLTRVCVQPVCKTWT